MRYCTENTVVAKSNTWGQALAPALIWAGEVILLRLCVLCYKTWWGQFVWMFFSLHADCFLFFVIVGVFLRLNKIIQYFRTFMVCHLYIQNYVYWLVINFAFTYQVAVFIPICLIGLYCLPLWVCPIQLFLRSNKTY